MTSGTDISALYQEFTDALTEVLAENSAGPARRGRLARARADCRGLTRKISKAKLAQGGLTIKGEKREEKEETKKDYSP